MTPKEKAWDLNQKFMELQHYLENNAWNNSKQCAIIAVDEIIDSNPYKLSLEGKFLTEHITYDINFWQDVKKEIEKL
jgi:hypothetical protein